MSYYTKFLQKVAKAIAREDSSCIIRAEHVSARLKKIQIFLFFSIVYLQADKQWYFYGVALLN